MESDPIDYLLTPLIIGFGISFLGLLRRNSSISSIFANAAPAQYDIAANATLTNGNFASNNPNAWETTSIIAITTPSNTAWSNVCKIGRIHLFTNMLN